MSDTEGQLSYRDMSSTADVDIWVLLLNGLDDIENVKFATSLGIEPSEVVASKSSATIEMLRVNLKFRLHLLPFIVDRKKVLIVDAELISQTYKSQCYDELIYGMMIGKRDQELRDRCKRNS